MALKAPPEIQTLLLDLQTIDTRLAQLDHRARSLPQLATIGELTGELDALRRTRLDQQGLVDNDQLELTRVESDVEVVEARIARDSERLAASSSVKDVAALDQELGALRKRLNDLEEIELSVMEKVEGHQGDLDATVARIEALSASRAEVELTRDAALAEIDAERKTAAAGRRTIEAKVPADLLALYEKQRSRYGTGASLLRGGVSLASGVKLLEDELQKIRAASPEDVLICPSSDAILVRTDESGL
jgi:predicted  nucleic acid-binding Zn-ribbon protein